MERRWDSHLDNLGIRLVAASPPTGKPYWRLVEARYLRPEENPKMGDRHHVFFRCLDEEGREVGGQYVCVGWAEGRGCTATKEGANFGASIPLWASYSLSEGPGPYYAEVDGLSDRVVGLGLPEGEEASFLLVFQRTVVGPSPERRLIAASKPRPEPAEVKAREKPKNQEASSKPIYHYLLLGPPATAGTRTRLLLALEYILHFGPAVGFLPEEAARAQYVTIVGGPETVSPEEEKGLSGAGCQVERLEGDAYSLEETFRSLLERGARFLTF